MYVVLLFDYRFVFFGIFSIYLAASAAKDCEKQAVNQLAASAASPDSVKFQAVIKSAASVASPKAKSRKPRPRGAPGRRPGWQMTASGRSPGSWVP